MKTIYVSDKTSMTLESMKNISQSHILYKTFYKKEVDDKFTCNVCDNAKVYGNTKVYGNAEVFGNATVYGYATVYGDAKVFENAEVYGNAEVFGNAQVWGNAKVFGNAEVFGNAKVYGDAKVYGNVKVFGDAQVSSLTYNLDFLEYKVTLTDNHIRIGCKQFTYEVALKLSKRDIGYLFSEEEYNDVIKDKKLIIELIKRKKPDLFIKQKEKGETK